MKYLIHLVSILFMLMLASCKDNSVSLGTVEYYPNFLWVDSCTTPVKKTFGFDFSKDARNDSSAFAELQLVYNDGKPVSTAVMQVYDEGQALTDNSVRVYSNVEFKELTFIFAPDAAIGKYQGYLRLVRHNLDRIESQQLNSGDIVDLFQWTLYYDKVMNPLAKFIMWIFIVIGVILLLWFLVMRPFLYPHFGKFTKSFLIKQNDVIVGQFNYAFKGARKVVFYDKLVKQSVWKRIFVGEIKTYINPLFKTKLTFSPRRKKAVAYGTGFSVTPNPIPRSGVATIINYMDKITIIIQ